MKRWNHTSDTPNAWHHTLISLHDITPSSLCRWSKRSSIERWDWRNDTKSCISPRKQLLISYKTDLEQEQHTATHHNTPQSKRKITDLLTHRLRDEIEEMTLQMQQAGPITCQIDRYHHGSEWQILSCLTKDRQILSRVRLTDTIMCQIDMCQTDIDWHRLTYTDMCQTDIDWHRLTYTDIDLHILTCVRLT